MIFNIYLLYHPDYLTFPEITPAGRTVSGQLSEVESTGSLGNPLSARDILKIPAEEWHPPYIPDSVYIQMHSGYPHLCVLYYHNISSKVKGCAEDPVSGRFKCHSYQIGNRSSLVAQSFAKNKINYEPFWSESSAAISFPL